MLAVTVTLRQGGDTMTTAIDAERCAENGTGPPRVVP